MEDGMASEGKSEEERMKETKTMEDKLEDSSG